MKIYLVGGASCFQVDQKLAELRRTYANTGNSRAYHLDELNSLSEISELAGSIGLFANDFYLEARNLFSGVKKILYDELYEYLSDKQASAQMMGTLVFNYYGVPDKRLKIWKLLNKLAIVNDYPEVSEGEKKAFIENWLQTNKYEIYQDDKLQLLHRLLVLSLEQIASELQKIKLLIQFEQRENFITQDLQLICQDVELEIWDLFALSLSDKKQAFAYLDKLLLQGVHPQMIVGYIASQLKQLTDYYYNKESVSFFISKKIAPVANRISTTKLQLLVEKLADLDYSFKRSTLDEALGLRMYLALL
jgi:DNA polymerase III delta subunit